MNHDRNPVFHSVGGTIFFSRPKHHRCMNVTGVWPEKKNQFRIYLSVFGSGKQIQTNRRKKYTTPNNW